MKNLLFFTIAFLTAAQAGITVFDGIESSENAISHNQSTPVDFGSYEVPMSGAAVRRFTVKNTGTTPLSISSVTITLPGTFNFYEAEFESLAPGASTSFFVGFTTNAVGTYSGSVSILSNSPTHPTFTFPITGTGLPDATPPTLSISMTGGIHANAGNVRSYFGQPLYHAKAGTPINLIISSDEPTLEPVISISGRSVSATGSGSIWSASILVDETFAQGPVEFTVIATDLLGNTTNTAAPWPFPSPLPFFSISGIVIVDTIPPRIGDGYMRSINPYNNFRWAKVGDTVEITFSAYDDAWYSGVIPGAVTVFGAPWTGGYSWDFFANVTLTTDPITTEPEGPVAVSFEFSDYAGNVTTMTPVPFSDPVFVDRTPPVITQADLTVEATSPEGATAFFDPTATDAHGAYASVSTNNYFASGSFFPLGTTPVPLIASDPAGNITTGNFNVTVLEASDFWRDSFFDQTNNDGDAADEADPDKDGIVNLIERAFNLHPIQAETPVLTAGSGSSGMPLVTVQGEGANKLLRIEYLRRKASSFPGMTYEAQFSTNLDDPNWTPATSESVSSIDDLWERVIVEDSPGGMQKFGRVKVTTP